jgi:neutral ceramidase
MGFAEASQVGTGLRQRLYCRAFIIGDPNNPRDRVVYLVQDIQSGDTAVRHGILDSLKTLGPEYDMYTKDNVAVTGTHSHSGPGGWTNYFLHHIASNGFDKQGWEAVVQGSILSIKRAHESLKEGRLSYSKIRVDGANINRSILGYEANPAEEVKNYTDNVEKDLSLLRFVDLSGTEMGMLTFFATHGTSLHSNNTLVTGDNKGVAAYLIEKNMPKGYVAGFSQSNVGDVSPNILGAFCEGGYDDGKPCEMKTETCSGRTQSCHARGPFYGQNDAGTKSCFEIGKRQSDKAIQLLREMKAGKETPISGPIRSFHTFHNMTYYSFPHPNGTTVQTCPPAFGYSFAAGTSDGPGIADFYQGIKGYRDVSIVWPLLSNIVKAPTDQQKACQSPKPILLDVGEMHWPYEWAASAVDLQLFRVGNLFMIISVGEATTMAGRRWKEAIKQAAKKEVFKGDSSVEPIVVLGGPSNTYSSYIATQEEYGVQRYEAASTLYGQHTLNAYIHLTTGLIKQLGDQRVASIQSGPLPPINNAVAWNFIPGVMPDYTINNNRFGQVIRKVNDTYARGEIANVTFMGANPRNNLRLESTYASIQKLMKNNAKTTLVERDSQSESQFPPPGGLPAHAGSSTMNATELDSDLANREPEQLSALDEADNWVTVRNDADWDLVIEFKREGLSLLNAPRMANLRWEIGQDVEPGRYRFVYNGEWRNILGQLTTFKGLSSPFDVT